MAGHIPLRLLHRTTGTVFGVFLALHLANHLAALGGQQLHIHVMAALRQVYRNPFVEPALLAIALWQALSGTTMAVRSWRNRQGLVAWAQAMSGLAIAAFLTVHVGAVVAGRAQGLDTDFNFAAAGIHAGFAAFFVPHYFLAVFALAVHIACAVHWRRPQRPGISLAIAGGGFAIAALLVALLAGLIVPVAIPAPYLASFQP